MRNIGKTLIIAAFAALATGSALAADFGGNPPGPRGGPGVGSHDKHPMAKHAVHHHRFVHRHVRHERHELHHKAAVREAGPGIHR